MPSDRMRSGRFAVGIVAGCQLVPGSLLELALGFSEGASKVGDLGAAEEQQDDDQDDNDFRRTDVHVRTLPG